MSKKEKKAATPEDGAAEKAPKSKKALIGGVVGAVVLARHRKDAMVDDDVDREVVG